MAGRKPMMHTKASEKKESMKMEKKEKPGFEKRERKMGVEPGKHMMPMKMKCGGKVKGK